MLIGATSAGTPLLCEHPTTLLKNEGWNTVPMTRATWRLAIVGHHRHQLRFDRKMSLDDVCQEWMWARQVPVCQVLSRMKLVPVAYAVSHLRIRVYYEQQ
jgi:hypothetical protein